MDPFFATLDRMSPFLLKGDLETCEKMACESLLSFPVSPFHIAAKLSITNRPEDVAGHFDRFFVQENGRFTVRSVYTEMNGFDINPDRWFCDLFAYQSDGGLEDLDWIADWDSESFPNLTITGLEELQAVYDSDAFRDPANRDASYQSSIVVVAKFQRLMQLAAEKMTKLRVPLYATAHDFDYVARIVTGGD